MYRVRSRSLLTDEIIDSEHLLKEEDANHVVDFFNTIYNHLFTFWMEPSLLEPNPQPTSSPSLETIDEYYLF
jgi:hypothetical protein